MQSLEKQHPRFSHIRLIGWVMIYVNEPQWSRWRNNHLVSAT
jgi:hypothetical protein